MAPCLLNPGLKQFGATLATLGHASIPALVATLVGVLIEGPGMPAVLEFINRSKSL